ncbi:hypothetical protein SeMB42_g01086 [Synchytrium endobioticum]|uniref:Uncharacterized protein n=1 Tax=Synchytrium endobioticum TaxID=286115 RepID=A0A507DJ15_9FUNG|nr:hypothetical protein SeLEV6574_g00240 [Synchytrium endobioticum]TPX52973.1 hypothetical protein SeMB42_g01086 [Synchytrium endobioticum]
MTAHKETGEGDENDCTGVRRNKILIVGPSESVLIQFISRLLRKTNQSDLVDAHLSASPSSASSFLAGDGLAIPFRLDTRYYTVETSLWISCLNTSLQDSSQWSVVAPAVDALIYVFDKSQPESFHRIKPWSTFSSTHDPNIALCIAYSLHDSTDNVPLGDCEDWCIENGFEFIDADDTGESSVVDDPVEAARAKFGLDRVIEALESNMWDGLVRKTPPYMGPSSNNNSRPTPLPSTIRNNISTTNPNDLASLYSHVFNSFTTDLSNGDMEDNIDGFEVALHQLKTLREQSRMLSDNERTEFAAKVALAFDKHFGTDENDNDANFEDYIT